MKRCFPCIEKNWCGILLVFSLFTMTSSLTSRPVVQNLMYDKEIIMFPSVEHRTVEAHSTIRITCISSLLSDWDNLKVTNVTWRLPDYLAKYPELSKAKDRLHIAWHSNNTHVSSTLTLSNAETGDTGYYECYLPLFPQMQVEQYIYVYALRSHYEPVFHNGTGIHIYTFNRGEIGFIPACKPTHPNMTISFKRKFSYWFENFYQDLLLKKDQIDLLTGPSSSWSLEPKHGLILKNASLNDSGMYECVGSIKGTSENQWQKNISIAAIGVDLTRTDDNQNVIKGSNITLVCRVYMFSSPPEWMYYDAHTKQMLVINETNLPKDIEVITEELSDEEDVKKIYKSRLELQNFGPNSPSQFQCKVKDLAEPLSEIISIELTDHRKSVTIEIVIIVTSTTIVLVLCILAVAVSYAKKRKREKILQMKTLNMFKRNSNMGNHTVITGDKFISMENADSLPYDEQWEFPRHRLKLGKQVGAGYFGLVVKADAVGLRKGSTKTVSTVAVKMARSQTNALALEALFNELKILIHVGSHMNVISLLGACTKLMSKGELLVLVEYCRFGNLQSYLVNHRSYFIDQVDEQGNFKKSYEENFNTDQNYLMVSSSEERERQKYETGSVLPDQMSNSSMNSTRFLRNSNQFMCDLKESEPYSFYQQDPEAVSTQTMSTQDLLCWSSQVARGMSYLASKRVLHGDLAARNVLLADDRVAKVADFGMARRMYNNCDYQKKGQGLLPIKWMAIESLIDRNFSSQSDVWSFGILLWEIFSLGKVPYPGMEVAHQFIECLENGYRMGKPGYAPNFVEEIMKNCWNIQPDGRPTFKELEERLDNYLQSCLSSYYLELGALNASCCEESDQTHQVSQSSHDRIFTTANVER